MLVISCISLISAVGRTPQSAGAALRAGISAFDELVYRDRSGSNVVGAMAAGVSAAVRGRARLEALVSWAVAGIPQGLAAELPWSQMPMLVCTPEGPRPGPRLDESALRRGITDDGPMPASLRIIDGGPVGAFVAFDQARRLLADPRVPGCLVLAVDSLIDAQVLDWLDQDFRLKTSDCSDGVIPGEAACLAIVTRKPVTPTALMLLGIGIAQEVATVRNDEPFLGQGMTRAVRAALDEARLDMHDVDFRLSDVAGESYAFEEMVLAQTRLMRRTRPSQPIWHHADCIGDCGAAAGLLEFAWAEQAFARGYAPGAIAALHGSSQFGARGAAIVTST